MTQKTIPKYRKQRETRGEDRAFVEIAGRRYHLGKYGSDASRTKYVQLLADMQLQGGRDPVLPHEITIAELCDSFWSFATPYYRKPNRDTTSELELFKAAMRPLLAIYARATVDAFGPLRLKAVRERMIELDWSRGYINKQVARIVRIFRWGVAEELVSSGVLHGLQSVAGLKRGRSGARETQGVMPVPGSVVEATLMHMTPTLRAMVETQRLTGMRPGELVLMRPCDLNMSGPVWTYLPERHKSEHRGRSRTVYLGPNAQRVLRPRLGCGLRNYIFSPMQSEAERRLALHAARKTSISCGNKPGSNRKARTKRGPTERYTTDTYAKAVSYACRRAFPTPEGKTGDDLRAWRREHCWSPNQLRHSFATEVRARHGLEAAQILLGHSKADVTQLYAERDAEKAIAVAARIG